MVLLCKLECFAVCWEFKLCLAIIVIYKLKGGKRGENFGNIASISQTHLFHKIYIHISLCMGYPANELFVLGLELHFQALYHSSTGLGAFKGPKIYGST